MTRSKTGKPVDSPLIPKGPLKALILYDDDYKQYYDRRSGKRLLEVTNQGITEYVIQNGRWKLYRQVN
ncbi:hypothetical protein [Gimesia sp.]|uniref:hypothetical protein n=1 Tax=Gimesia sp. TaxID=2024833 RepID=UPI003A914126